MSFAIAPTSSCQRLGRAPLLQLCLIERLNQPLLNCSVQPVILALPSQEGQLTEIKGEGAVRLSSAFVV